jgi:hypothetical protein
MIGRVRIRALQVARAELKDEGFLHERLLVLDHGARRGRSAPHVSAGGSERMRIGPPDRTLEQPTG